MALRLFPKDRDVLDQDMDPLRGLTHPLIFELPDAPIAELIAPSNKCRASLAFTRVVRSGFFGGRGRPRIAGFPNASAIIPAIPFWESDYLPVTVVGGIPPLTPG